jgi:hypothetical protein
MQKSRRVVANWYIIGDTLYWWVKDEQPPGTAGTTKGRDHTGMEGNFTGHQIKIKSWEREKKDGPWIIYDENGQGHYAQFSTHYSNRRHPKQCCRDAGTLEVKLYATAGSPTNGR